MKTSIAFIFAALTALAAGASTFGAGVGGGDNARVSAIAVDAMGNVYVGGSFSTAGGVSVNNIAKWDGTTWSALGSGVEGTGPVGSGTDAHEVYALACSGTDLYVGGSFNKAGGQSVANVAKWDGANWSALGTGCDGRVSVLAMVGANLFAGGEFVNAGGMLVNKIAKWNGTAWSPMAILYPGVTGGHVLAMTLIGNGLYVGGSFSSVEKEPPT